MRLQSPPESCFQTVTATRRDVEAFVATYPCSGLPRRAISFTFDRRNGDLVDLSPSSVDGSAAVALSQDAQQYARSKGRLQ